MSELTDWNSFYVIVGSSAGALIGLQFVVIALIAETPDARADAQAGAAFSTPSVGAFRSRAVVDSDYQRSVAYDRRCRSCLGLNGHQWDCVCPPSSWLGVCDCKRPIDLYSRIGCFTLCFRLRRMEFWPSRHTWRSPMRAQPCSSLPPRRCYSCSLAFTTRGTRLHITFLSGVENLKADRHR